MHLQYTPFALLAFVAAITSALLALLGARRRPAPGAAWFSLLMLSLAWWSLGYAFELLSIDLAAIVFWAKVQYVGISAAPVLWLTLVLAYTDRSKWLTRQNLTLLFIVPVLTQLLVWTNEFHKLIWMNVTLNTDGPFVRMDFSQGPWYWVNVIYAYALILLSILLLIRSLLRSSGLYRGQFAVLLIGSLVPWLGNLIYMTGLSFSHLDLTPFAFTLTGLSGGWGLLHYRLLDIVPVARDAVIESMSDAVMVFNAQNHLVDLNPAAQEIIGQPAREVIGQPAGRVLPDWRALVEQYQSITEAHTEITAVTEEGKRHLDLSISPLYDRQGRLTGRLMVFRDITERKQVEVELKTYQEQLEELVQVRTKELTQTNEQLVKEIDERKRVEEALRYSEQNLVRAQSIAHIGSWDWDIVGNTLAWSDELYRVFGVSPKSFELTYDNIASMIHPDDHDRNEVKIQELLATADRVDYEFRIIRPDGLIRHIYQMVEISHDGEGESRRAFGIMMDITERKQADEALRESERFVRSTLDGLSAHIAIVAQTGTILAVNQAWRNFAEANPPVTSNVCEGANYLAVCDAATGKDSEGAAEFVAAIRAVLAGNEETVEIEYPCHSPTENRWFIGRVTRFPGDGPPRVVVAHESITERKQIEEALRQSEERYRLLAETARDIILVHDMEGYIRYVNEAGISLGGFEPGESITAYIPTENLDNAAHRKQTRAGGDHTTYKYEAAFLNREGQQIPVEVHSNFILYNGEAHIMIAARDITERKRAEEALRESQRMLSTLMSNLPGIAYRRHNDRQWTMEFISEGCLEITGYQPNDLLDNQAIAWADVIHPDDRQTVWDTTQAAIQEDRPFQYTYRITTRNGEEKWIWEQGSPVRSSGSSIYLEGFMADITARVQAEEALAHERDLMHMLMNNVPDAIYFKDANSRFTRINLAQAKMLGCATPEDALGKTDLDFYSPEFALETLDDERRIIITGQAQSGKIEQLKWLDGRVRWGSASKAPIRDSQGQVTGIVGITRDITERILAEEALTQRVGQLELLNQVSRNLTAELSLDYLLSNAASLIQESFGYPHIGLFLVEHEQEELVMKARAGSYAAFFPLNHRLDLDEGITGWVARNGQRLLIGDVRRDPRYYNPFPEQLILSELSVPIKWRGEVVGVLDIQSDRLDAFDSNDVLVLETLADQLAAAIQNASLLIQTQLALVELMAAEAAEREQRALAEALVNVAAELNSTLDFEEVLEKILENVGYIAPYDSANIMLLENGIARVVHQKGRREDTEKFIWTVAETPTLSQMVKKNEPVAISDTQTDPIWVETIRWIRSYAGAPIRLNEEVIGFISLNGARPDMFTTEHARRLQAFANQTAIAIANARLYHELEVYSGILEQAVEERTAELQQTKERVETILNYSPDPILLLKPDGAIETANPAFKQVFGFHVDDLHRQLPTNLVIPDHANRVQAALQSAIDEHQVMRLELTARHQDGTTFDAEVALAPISENKNLLGIVCSVRDISALKEVERMKDAFVSNVSHELRTPITSLKLSHRLIEMDPENREEYMGRLSREVNRLNDLIEDLLRLSRLDQGRVELNLQPVDLNELAQQYVNDRSPLAESKELSLLFEGEKDVMPVQADEGLIGQVLSILLTNALNYTPAGGRVTVSTHMKEIDGKRWVGHSVSDTGPGITPDDQPHLFERFYRGKAGHDSGAPGTGLGLAIAHEIVDQHRGKIDVESEGVPGKGATFTVWLPFHM